MIRYILFIVFLSSCMGSSFEDFREEGRAINKSIIKELQQIHSKEELTKRFNTLEKLFDRLVDVMILSKEHKKGESLGVDSKDIVVSDRLRLEMNRIYKIPGAKKVFEKIQKKASATS